VREADRDVLKTTFDGVAELYDRARPQYPEALFDDIVELAELEAGASLLEVGCGTGRATEPLARRGFNILCLEPGARLAAVARRNLAPFPDVEVVVESFEDWNAAGRTFDLVLAATSWHWIDPEVGYARAASLLNADGRLAFFSASHAFPEDADRFFYEIQEVYETLGETRPGETWPPPLPEDVPDETDGILASGFFGRVETRRHVWEVTYTADEYIDLLRTFSVHIAMAPEKRRCLEDEVRRRVSARPEGTIRRHADHPPRRPPDLELGVISAVPPGMRFLQQDQFNGALSNLSLSTDPLIEQVPAYSYDQEPGAMNTTPRIWVDCMKVDEDRRLVLTTRGTIEDLKRLGIELQEGLRLNVYSDDADDQGNPR